MVEIVGSYMLEASIDEVWPHIFDPASLMSLIPGCQQLEQVAVKNHMSKAGRRVGPPKTPWMKRLDVQIPI